MTVALKIDLAVDLREDVRESDVLCDFGMEVETIGVPINSVWKLEVTRDVTSKVALGVTTEVTFITTLDVTVYVTLLFACDDLTSGVASTRDETIEAIELVINDGVILTDESVTRVGVTPRLIDVLRVTMFILL